MSSYSDFCVCMCGFGVTTLITLNFKLNSLLLFILDLSAY